MLQERWVNDGRLVIFIPRLNDEPQNQINDDLIDWYDRAMDIADVSTFWCPEDVDLYWFPATVAAGKDDRRVVCGAPLHHPQSGYLLRYAKHNAISVVTTLSDMATKVLDLIGRGAPRIAGEREIPLHVWQTESFQRWYAAQTTAGNELRGARLVWTFNTGPQKKLLLYWALHVSVWVRAEHRIKSNEVVVSRPDISVLAFYQRRPNIDETIIILVREFRSPASTPDGLVHELPSGSGSDGSDARDQAVKEAEEETGLAIDVSRIRSYGSRQLAATVSAHHAHLFAAEITDEELAQLRTAQEEMHGSDDIEQTWTEITTFGDLRRNSIVDWTTLGMISEIILDIAAELYPRTL